ncbi:MAG TPA: iron-containing alcohol dehydrogenase [Clostridiales bacterium]|nr:iron-containing alcohol dehydrogenase [Clostridiales bacterium]
MDFNFLMPVKVISGEGCVLKSAKLLRSLGRRCLIMTSRSAAKTSGALDDLISTLEEAKINYTIFSEISPNPLLSQCQAAAYAAQLCRSQFIIGVGGGSVMDAAKAAAWLANNNCSAGEKLMKGELRHGPLPLVLIGTTAGTGSEVTPAAVLTMDKTGQKRSITHHNCFADIAFADPRYTYTVNRDHTVSAALDAFSHAVEGWFAPACGDLPTAFGEKALPLILEGLEWMSENDGLPEKEMRDKLYYGSLWAGMVLNATGTAFPHPLGYILTEEYSVPHGMACAVFLPALLERAEKYCKDRAERLYSLCGGRDRVFAILGRLVSHNVRMGSEQIESYKPRWEGVKNFERTPGGFTAEDAAGVFRSLFLD